MAGIVAVNVAKVEVCGETQPKGGTVERSQNQRRAEDLQVGPVSSMQANGRARHRLAVPAQCERGESSSLFLHVWG